MNEDKDITLKIRGLPKLNELQLAQQEYNKTFDALIKEPTQVNLNAFKKAYKHLFEVKDAYSLAWVLLQERTNRLKEAFLDILF